jgi:hypothetical protein
MQNYSSMNNPAFSSANRTSDTARELQSVLLLAAGAAWAFVAYRALSETRRYDARRKVHAVSSHILHQVFPDGIRP